MLNSPLFYPCLPQTTDEGLPGPPIHKYPLDNCLSLPLPSPLAYEPVSLRHCRGMITHG